MTEDLGYLSDSALSWLARIEKTVASPDGRFEAELAARKAGARMKEHSRKSMVERLAAHCHDQQWSGWMEYLFSKCEESFDSNGFVALTIPNWAVERWAMQMSTPYAELPESMKESDREEARKILALVLDEEQE